MSKQQGNRLDFITAQDTQRIEAARTSRHSRWVRRGRWMLPLAAVAVLIILLVWPLITVERIKTAAMKSVPDLVLEHVHFRGLDEKNQPYEVLADRATRPSSEKNIVILQNPEGKLALSGQSTISSSSQIGRYDEAAKRLWLGGRVRMLHDRGYEMLSEEALVDIPKNTAWGMKPVTIQGDFGVIQGVGFDYFGDAAVVVVHGPAKAILNLHPSEGSARQK